MRETIESLFQSYYNATPIIRDIFIFKKRGEQIINVFPNLAAVKWGLMMHGSTEIPDIDKQDRILEAERLRLAKQIYQLAEKALKYKKKLDEFQRLYGKYSLDTNSHKELVDYSLEAFYWLEILTPYEYDTSEPQMDEHGVLVGMKKMPKPKNNALMEDIEKFAGKSEESDDG